MARKPVQETPFLPLQIEDLVRQLIAQFAAYGQAINDDLITRPDWTRVITAATYAMLDTDRFLLVDATAAPITITLPPVADCEPHFYGIKRTNSGANAVTVATNGSDAIDGSASNRSLAAQWEHILMLTDRVAWFLLHLGAP